MTIEQPEALRLANVIKGSGQFTDLLSLDAAAAELRRMHTENEILIAENASMRSAFDRLGCAYDEWIEKTDWVQKSTKLAELGRHRADILRLRIESLHTENETLRHKLQTLDELGAAGDDVQLLRTGYAAARLEIASLQGRVNECGAGAGCCAQAARIAELEAQLEAVGAGGVGPLGGATAQPQDGVAFELWRTDHMPDTSQEEALAEWCTLHSGQAAQPAAQAQAVPAPGEPSEAPHAELRKIWRKGQRWQTRGDPAGPWLDTTPCWHADREYRRHPDDAAVTTALLAAERESLQCDYCGAVTDDPWHSSGMLHGQLSRHIHSCDICAAQAQEDAMDSAMESEPDQPESMPLTQKEIIGMAREAGIEVHPRKDSIRIGSAILTGCDSTEEVTRFAALVAAAERRACTAACEKVKQQAKATANSSFVTDAGKDVHNAMAAGAHNCIAAIAARGSNGH